MFKLLKYSKGYVLPALLSPLFVMTDTIMQVLIPLIMADIIDIGITNSDQLYVTQHGLIMIGLALGSLVFGYLSGYFATKASAGLGKNLRKDLFEKIQSYSFSNIDKFSASSLITRLTTDVTNVQQSFQMIIRIFFRAPVMFVFALIMAYTRNVELSNIFSIAAVCLILIVLVVVYPANKLYQQMFKKYDRMNLVTQENINGIKTVKAYTTEADESRKFAQASKETRYYATKADTLGVLVSPMAMGVIYITSLIVAYIGGQMIVVGTMKAGELTLFITYAGQILFAILMVCAITIMVVMSKASADRINQVLDETPTIRDPENPITDVSDGSVEFKDVSFSYTGDINKLALSHITFKAESGEFIGIFGSTGSSKTTLVSLIDRLYDVTEGQVLVGGKNVKDYSLFALRENCSVVLQKNILFSGTIRSNLQWGNSLATDEEIMKACDEAQASEFINSNPLGLDAPVEEEGINFSGGQKQRLCIARALLKNPKILILDDSTSAVDTKTDALIQDAFRKNHPNTTKFIISQRISSLQKADKILIMENGTLSASGSHEELLKSSELYRSINDVQVSDVGKEIKE